MAVVTTNMTQRNNAGVAQGPGIGGIRVLPVTVETVGSESVASVFVLGKIPSNARILGSSRMQCDDIGAATAALKVGLFGTSSDDDALTASLSVAAATTGFGLQVLSDHANIGKRAWELMSGVSADPNEDLTIKATLHTAAIDAVGTLSFEIFYSLD